jgi:hypothetical protein
MRVLSLVIISLLLASCGRMERTAASITGGGFETCHEGVAYVQFTSGTSVKYNVDGTIATC